MVLTSIDFVVFLFFATTIYFLTPRRYRWVTLFVVNLCFYGLAGGGHFLYLIITTVSVYAIALWLGREIEENQEAWNEQKVYLNKEDKKQWKADFTKRKKKILFVGLGINLGILCVVKYTTFVLDSLGSIWNRSEGTNVDFLLPLGISFYTFQALGYLIDVYREKYQPERNLIKFSLFISYFPQVVQGPIGRYPELSKQLYRPNKFSYERAKHGIQLMMWGAFQKLVVSDRAGVLVGAVFGDFETYSGIYILFACMIYSIQIYGDFAGGINIATGASQILGIDLEKNFERPYLATSIADFWRRWHITLGAWFRDYVFYPLSLSKFFMKVGKKGRAVFGNDIGKLLPVLFPQFIIFFLIGVWHGAEWKYVAFGFYNGVLIVLGLLFEKPLRTFVKQFKIRTECFSFRLFQVVRTFIIVSLGKLITRAEDIEQTVLLKDSMIQNWDFDYFRETGLLVLGLDTHDLWIFFLSCGLWLSVSLMQEKGIKLRETLSQQNIPFRWTIYLIGMFALILFANYGLEYDATDFIYRGF